MAKKQKYRNSIAPHKGKVKSNLSRSDNLIFVVCIIIALLFWALIKLSHDYPASYTFKLKYKNAPVEKRLTGLVDTTVNIKFSAVGYSIIKLALFEDMTELTIDLENFNLMKKESNEYFIYTDELKEEMASRVNLPATEIDFSRTTIGFILEDLHEKEVEVLSNIKLQFKEQFDLYEKEIITPTSVKVFGPKGVLDTIDHVYTQNITLRDVDSDRDIMIYIENPDSDLLHFDPDFVSLKIRVEKFTESSIDTPIDFSGIDENIKSFPAVAKVYFKVAQKDFNNIESGQFRVAPEIGGVSLHDVDKLHLTIEEKPDFIRNEWIVPADVEFLIIK